MESKEELAIKALEVIEMLVMEENPFEQDKFLAKIYRLAHAGTSPSCAYTHPDWEREVEEIHAVLKAQ